MKGKIEAWQNPVASPKTCRNLLLLLVLTCGVTWPTIAAGESWERVVRAGQGPVLTHSLPRPCSANRTLCAAAQAQGGTGAAVCARLLREFAGVRGGRGGCGQPGAVPGLCAGPLRGGCPPRPPPIFRRWRLYCYSDMTGNQKDHLCFLSLCCQRACSLIWWGWELNPGQINH